MYKVRLGMCDATVQLRINVKMILDLDDTFNSIELEE